MSGSAVVSRVWKETRKCMVDSTTTLFILLDFSIAFISL